jgi:hypothetical protein
MKLLPFNRGPLFTNCFESTFVDQTGNEIRISESKPICSPAPTEYWMRKDSISTMITQYQYESLLYIITEP